jgi:hypothetical protein
LSCFKLDDLSLAMGMKELSKLLTGPCFGIVALDPCSVASDNVSYQVCIWFCALKNVSCFEQVIFLLFGHEHSRNELCCHTSHAQIFSQNCKTWTDQIPTSLDISLIINLLSLFNNSRTMSIITLFVLVSGHPECLLPSTDVRSSLKQVHHSKTWVRLMESSLKAILIILYVSVQVFPSFW